ncbi:hypothetical protein [Metabacillus endolithicus]|nr:hypothetical protein [Metabacillus endolithicus]UPG64495.1 hypothetical protein MVE64_05250 [Metabacillus endolithicus]
MGTTRIPISVKKGTTSKSIFEFDNTNLAPGTYLVKLVLYKVNEFGTDELLDVVPSAFGFEMNSKSGDTNNLEWTHRYWGHIKFNNLTIQEPKVLI